MHPGHAESKINHLDTFTNTSDIMLIFVISNQLYGYTYCFGDIGVKSLIFFSVLFFLES